MITRRRTKLHPYRVTFWSVVAVIGALALLHRYPITLDAGDPSLGGRTHTVEANGDVLVVVSEEMIAEAAGGGQFDRSWAWVDLVRQEIGPVTCVDAAVLDSETLQSHRVVVVTTSAARDARVAALVDDLDAFATNGGLLALELPEGLLRSTFAADGQGGWRRAGAITAAEGVSPEIHAQMLEIPLLTRFVGSTRPLADAETMLAIDGAPVIYTRTRGSGEVVIVDFELGAQIARLQQGAPGPDFRVTPRRHGEPTRTFDLAATPALIGATIPYADLLERYVAHAVLGHHAPMFALWPYPESGHGALITSHDSRRLDGRPLWMSIHERSLDARTSTFVAAPAADPAEGPPPADPDFVGHAAMMWTLNPDDAGLFRRYGLLGLSPVRQSLTLVGQFEQLEAALGDDANIQGVRIWDGRWTSEFAAPFRVMEAAEFRYSASYGPPPFAPPGYLFGTCQPFTPVDVNGLPFRIQEVPVCFHDPRTPESIEVLHEAMESAARDAWAVHLLTSSDRFQTDPSLTAFEVWRDALRFADSNDMWVGGAGELVQFWRRRSAAELRVISSEVTSRTADGAARVIEYTVEAETGGRGLVLMVPAEFGALRFEQATRGGQQARFGDLAGQVDTAISTYLGREYRLIPLNPGFTTVGLTYRN